MYTSIEGPPKIYEEAMRQLEAEIRKHIGIEHQLRLQCESLEDKVELLEAIDKKKALDSKKLNEQVKNLKIDRESNIAII
jgi:hypothetical protein